MENNGGISAWNVLKLSLCSICAFDDDDDEDDDDDCYIQITNFTPSFTQPFIHVGIS